MFASLAADLVLSARERVRQTLVRTLLALLVAWSLHRSGHDGLAAGWIGLSAAVQALEFVAMRPFRRAGAEAPSTPAAVIPALIAVVCMSGAYAGAAATLWRIGSPALITVGVLSLCGGLLNNVASGRGSRTLFLLGAGPYLAALAALTVLPARQAARDHLPLMILAVLLFALGVFSAWNRTHKAQKAESAALLQAQTRLEQAEAAMADRAAMAAVVSHELRTPVSAILAGAHVIRHGDRPDQTPETADLIIDAGRLMTSMLNDLLDHSKIEARGMSLETRDFDLTALVADTARFWRPQAEGKGLSFRVSGMDDGPLWLRGDPFRLRQILNNLLSNAFKFTARGVVALEAAMEPAPGGRRRIRLVVRDQGAGISAEAMERLFTPFAQGSSEVARTYGGTGLGLTVSRELARLMGGELTAVSEPGGGAAFTLDLVLAEGEPVETTEGYDAPAPAMARRMRVLAVDDHEINRRTLSLVLQPLDVDLALAVDGHEALKRLADQAFDVVLMDVNMPGIDGNETTRRLRASDGINAATPVIGFSAGTEADQIAACHAAGMTDWLAKPLEPRRLYEALERAVRKSPADAA